MSVAAPKLVVVDGAPDAGVSTGSDVTTIGAVVRRRLDGDYALDAWGLDEDVTRLAGRLSALRWTTTVLGLESIPKEGPALLVANRRLGWSEPSVVASALLRETGRIVRPVGGITVEPIGGILRRFGALPARPEEVAAALRAGNVVVVPTRREPVRNRPGHLPLDLVATAVTEGVPLIPVAVVGWELGRRWTVRIGEPVDLIEPVDVDGDPRNVARIVGAAAVEVASSLDALLTAGHEHDLGARLLSAVPGVDLRVASSDTNESSEGCDATGPHIVDGEWEGI